MPAISLSTSENSLLEFLLIAGSESLDEGSTKRECILACPPESAVDMEHPISLARTEHLHEEHRANVHSTDEGIDMSVSIADRAHLTISIHKNGSGPWGLSGGFDDATGACQLAQPKPK
jgi:hypothetical protein